MQRQRQFQFYWGWSKANWKLNVNKVSQSSDIPLKGLKENTDISNNFLCSSFNNSIKLSTFPEIPKHADITPLYKKGKKDIKGNYRPVGILPNLSKIFEKCMFEQMPQFFKNIFSKYEIYIETILFFENIFSKWISERFRYPAMSSGNVRKMEKFYR